jgi:hypothetical protein
MFESPADKPEPEIAYTNGSTASYPHSADVPPNNLEAEPEPEPEPEVTYTNGSTASYPHSAKVPPNNPEAEQSILGAILLENPQIKKIPELSTIDFYIDRNQ